MNTWKKKVTAAVIGLGMVMLGKGMASAAASADISVVVQVQVVSVSVATTTWTISAGGAIVPASVHTSSAIAVTNNGNIQEDYRLSLAEGGGWAPSEADATAATDEFVLLAQFTNTASSSMNDASFNDGGGTDDVVTTVAQAATSTLFAINADAAGVKGYDVAAAATRNLFLDFRAPTSNTVAATQYITVTVSAIAG